MNTAIFLGLKYNRMTMMLSEVCEELGIAVGTGHNMIATCQFPIPTRKQGRNRIADIRDVAEYIDDQRKHARDAFGV